MYTLKHRVSKYKQKLMQLKGDTHEFTIIVRDSNSSLIN